MPKGYIIGHVTVHDQAAYQPYIDRNMGIFAQYGAKILVRGGASQMPEGETFARHIVFEFPDYASAQAAYNDPAYQENMKIRTANATSMIVIAEGAD